MADQPDPSNSVHFTRTSGMVRMGHVVAGQIFGGRGNVFMYSSGRSTAGESVWPRGSGIPPCGWQRCRGRAGCKQEMYGDQGRRREVRVAKGVNRRCAEIRVEGGKKRHRELGWR